MSQIYKEEEIGDFSFGDDAAPEGFNPDRPAYQDPPPGQHVFEITGFEVEDGKTFNWKGEKYPLCQLRPKMKVVGGEHEGASIMAFLPMPTPGKPWCGGLASQWGQFVKALGFTIPDGKVVPAGFKLPMLKGCQCRATVEIQRDPGTKKERLKDDGTPWVGIKMFSFEPVNADTGAATPAKAAADIDL